MGCGASSNSKVVPMDALARQNPKPAIEKTVLDEERRQFEAERKAFEEQKRAFELQLEAFKKEKAEVSLCVFFPRIQK